MHLKFIFTLISVISFHQSTNSCEKLDTMYLDPEIILNKGSRDLGIKVLDARAVRSPDFKNFYFVQYKLDTPNNGIIFPMFAMNKPFKCCGTIYSMDEIAETVSGYGDGRKTKAKFSALDRGFSKANRCLKK